MIWYIHAWEMYMCQQHAHTPTPSKMSTMNVLQRCLHPPGSRGLCGPGVHQIVCTCSCAQACIQDICFNEEREYTCKWMEMQKIIFSVILECHKYWCWSHCAGPAWFCRSAPGHAGFGPHRQRQRSRCEQHEGPPQYMRKFLCFGLLLLLMWNMQGFTRWVVYQSTWFYREVCSHSRPLCVCCDCSLMLWWISLPTRSWCWIWKWNEILFLRQKCAVLKTVFGVGAD